MRRRLGIAAWYEGPDPHGHHRLADGTGGRTDTRHRQVVAAWRQVLQEAGGIIPQRNVERTLATTNIPVPMSDRRRLDLIVPGLSNVDRGLPLFCDVTVFSPITRAGLPRSGTSNRGGSLLETAEDTYNATYREVIESGLGSLQCLGAEVYGR